MPFLHDQEEGDGVHQGDKVLALIGKARTLGELLTK
jgi:hypothetical protein